MLCAVKNWGFYISTIYTRALYYIYPDGATIGHVVTSTPVKLLSVSRNQQQQQQL